MTNKTQHKPMSKKEIRENDKKLTDSKVETLIKDTNRAVKSVNTSTKKLYEVVRDAYHELKDDKHALKKYRANIDLDESTVRKMIAIAKNKTIMSNQNVLPVAYSVLYAISRIEEPTLQDAIKANMFRPIMTLQEVNELRTKLANKTSVQETSDDKTTARTKEQKSKQINHARQTISVNTMKIDTQKLNLSVKKLNDLRTAIRLLQSCQIVITNADEFLDDQKLAA